MHTDIQYSSIYMHYEKDDKFAQGFVYLYQCRRHFQTPQNVWLCEDMAIDYRETSFLLPSIRKKITWKVNTK